MNLGFMSDVRLTSAKAIYLLDCRAARLAPRTVRAYRDVLTRFITFTGDITVQELKPDHVRIYIAELSAQGGPMSKHYMVIRLWIRWLYAQKFLTKRSNEHAQPPRFLTRRFYFRSTDFNPGRKEQSPITQSRANFLILPWNP